MTDILTELTRVRAIFQLRAIKAAMGIGPTVLELTDVVTPGERVIEREQRSKLARKAHIAAEDRHRAKCLEKFGLESKRWDV